MTTRRPTRLVLAALGVLAAAGCGESTIDPNKVSGQIVTQFKAQGAELREVKCADGVKAEVGAKVICTALNQAETKLNIEGEVTELKGDEARFKVRGVGGVAKGTAVAADAKKLLEAQVGESLKATECPEEVPVPTTPDVTCTITALDGTQLDAKVVFNDKGQMRVKVEGG